jgi:hypothetical protein
MTPGFYGWVRVSNPEFERIWREQCGDSAPVPETWQHRKGLTAVVGREPLGPKQDDWRWHISLRFGDPGRNGRVPTWKEMVEAAHQLRPGVVFCIPMPPKSWWLNVHDDVLHLHEIHDEPLVELWKAQRMGHQPT